MHTKTLLNAGALMLSLFVGVQLAQARTSSESGTPGGGMALSDRGNGTSVLSDQFHNDRYPTRPGYQDYRYKLAIGGVPAWMIDACGYGGQEYYDFRQGRWRPCYSHQAPRHHRSGRR